MKRESERPRICVRPSVRRSEAKNSLWDPRAARATGRGRACTLPRRRAVEAVRFRVSDSLGVGSVHLLSLEL